MFYSYQFQFNFHFVKIIPPMATRFDDYFLTSLHHMQTSDISSTSDIIKLVFLFSFSHQLINGNKLFSFSEHIIKSTHISREKKYAPVEEQKKKKPIVGFFFFFFFLFNFCILASRSPEKKETFFEFIPYFFYSNKQTKTV